MIKFKKGDQVLVTGGKDKGKKAKVDHVLKDGTLIALPGINVYKRHMKKRSEKEEGGIREISRPLPVGNIALICPKCHKPTRVGFEIKGKEKTRICKKCNATI